MSGTSSRGWTLRDHRAANAATGPMGCSRKPRGNSPSAWPMRTRSAWRTSNPREPLRAGARRGCRSRTAEIPRDRRVPSSTRAGDRGHAPGRPGALAAAHRLGSRPARTPHAQGKGRQDDVAGRVLMLYALSKLRPLRRGSLRFARGAGVATAWLDLVAETARSDYALALQVARMRSLVKGYGDTHERGRMNSVGWSPLLPALRGRSDPGALLEGLIKAALADEEGRAWTKLSPRSYRRWAPVQRQAQNAGPHSPWRFPVAMSEIIATGASRRKAMPYDLDQFTSDCRAILARDPGPNGREEVRLRLEQLLSNKDFVDTYCGDGAARPEAAVRGPEARLPDSRAHQRQGPGLAAARPRRVLGDLRPGYAIHRHDRVGARGRRHEPRTRPSSSRSRSIASRRAMPVSTRTARSTRSTIRTTRASSA